MRFMSNLSQGVPNSSHVSEIIRIHYAVQPESIQRFTTGNHHYVYDCWLPGGENVVARVALPSEREAIIGGIHWNHELRAKNLPLPELYFSNADSEFPYMLLERLRGRDLGHVISTMSETEQNEIAQRLMVMQKVVADSYPATRFGYAIFAEQAPFRYWAEELGRSLQRSRSRILSAGVMDLKFVDHVFNGLNKPFSSERKLQLETIFSEIWGSK